ncbi:MAG TPA: DUF1444 family protein [Candidatus Limnocylindrales bacterium]|jgi:hypothetical protein|nr:DUF1444 family protein [Candidatus Limnocylindrales bacterium]
MEGDRPGGSDFGRDNVRDLGDEPPASFRDHAPDVLAPIDASAPVSGHTPSHEAHASMAESPEHDWAAAEPIIFPLLRPTGTQGMAITTVDAVALAADSVRSHSQPLVDEGPCELSVVYAIPGSGFDVIVNADHLLSWGVSVAEIQDAALRNLTAWSATAPWTDEVSGERRLISSDTGDGWDASRVLLTEVRERLAAELGGVGRVLIGLPERHLMIAGALRPGDDEFASLFAEFVLEHSGGADEPVDRRVFELVRGQLREFSGLPTPA